MSMKTYLSKYIYACLSFVILLFNQTSWNAKNKTTQPKKPKQAKEKFIIDENIACYWPKINNEAITLQPILHRNTNNKIEKEIKSINQEPQKQIETLSKKQELSKNKLKTTWYKLWDAISVFVTTGIFLSSLYYCFKPSKITPYKTKSI